MCTYTRIVVIVVSLMLWMPDLQAQSVGYRGGFSIAGEGDNVGLALSGVVACPLGKGFGVQASLGFTHIARLSTKDLLRNDIHTSLILPLSATITPLTYGNGGLTFGVGGAVRRRWDRDVYAVETFTPADPSIPPTVTVYDRFEGRWDVGSTVFAEGHLFRIGPGNLGAYARWYTFDGGTSLFESGVILSFELP